MPAEDKAAQWARVIIEHELNRPVALHDDGSQPSMYDLRIGPVDSPEMAIEVVGALDAQFSETWNVGPAREPLRLRIEGDWIIAPSRDASVRTIKQRVEPILRELEEQGRFTIHVDEDLAWYDKRLFHMFESLKITYAACYNRVGNGLVSMVMEGNGGVVDEAGNGMAQWLDAFLHDPQRADVLSKLNKSCATERHVFIPVSPQGAPWQIESYLMLGLDSLPAAAPNLPTEVTGVWVAHTFPFNGRGVRWDRGGWHIFEVTEPSS